MARGPAYPYTDLASAVGLLRKLYDFARRGGAAVDAVAKEAWKWSPTSSNPAKAVAALKYFGLVDEVPGDSKQIKLSDRGYRILVDDPASPVRIKALQEAALSPPQYAFCYKTWGSDPAPSARSTLIFERGFVESTVDGFLKDYRKTMAFAGMPAQADDRVKDEDSADKQAAKNGVDSPQQFGQAADVAFKQSKQAQTAPTVKEASVMRQDVFSIDEGAVRIEWPAFLSAESLRDIEDWLEIVKRKISRSSQKASDNGQEEAAAKE